MVVNKEYYDCLEVSPDATIDEIKKAFRKKAVKLHPDKPTGDEEKFKKLSEAYEILSDPDKRENYDRFGKDGVKDVPHRSASSIFEEMFGNFGFSMRPTKKKTPDIRHTLNVSLEELYFGKSKKLKLKRKKICKGCQGTGSKSGQQQNCDSCSGQGVKVQHVKRGPMIMQTQRQCSDCGGSGKKVIDPCISCNGNMVIEDTDLIEIEIPAGMREGEQLVFPSYAEEYPGAETGNLIILVKQTPHEIFTRNGDDLHMTKDITLGEALLGFQFFINHLDLKKRTELKVPGIVEPGEVKQFEGMGMPRDKKTFGNLIIHFNIVFPKSLDARQEKLVRRAFG